MDQSDAGSASIFPRRTNRMLCGCAPLRLPPQVALPQQREDLLRRRDLDLTQPGHHRALSGIVSTKSAC
eukprot:706230-Prorocentrum_minimum.AAC.1